MESGIPVKRLTLDDNFVMLADYEKRRQIEEWCEGNLGEVLEGMERRWRTSYGMDFGRSGDLSYLAVLQESPDLVRKTVLALEMRNVPFRQQEQVLFWIGDRLPRLVGGAHDARGNGEYLAEVAAERYGGYRIEQVKLTQQWYLENMPRYKSALEDKKIVLPACSELLDDHRLVEVIRGIPKVPDTRTVGSTGSRHGDGAIAFALAWSASCRESEPVVPVLGSRSYEGFGL